MPEPTAVLCTGLLTALRQRLTDRDFLARHRQSAKDFTRQCCLPFVVVIFFLLNLVKRALQDELDEFFNLERGAAVAARTVTKSAFCVGLWDVVAAFLATGLPEQIVTLTPGAAACADCRTHHLPTQPLQVRDEGYGRAAAPPDGDCRYLGQPIANDAPHGRTDPPRPQVSQEQNRQAQTFRHDLQTTSLP